MRQNLYRRTYNLHILKNVLEIKYKGLDIEKSIIFQNNIKKIFQKNT